MRPNPPPLAALLVLISLILGLASCHSEPAVSRDDIDLVSTSDSHAAELLEMLQASAESNPSRFVEVEIGTFRVTHKAAADGEPLLVKFRLIGLVSAGKQQRLLAELPNYDKRIRDAVISLVQKSDAEQLAEPGLKWLKGELVAAINRVVQDRALAGIAFSDFSLEGT